MAGNPLLSGSPAVPLVGITQNPTTTQNPDATVSIVGMGRNGGVMTAPVRGQYGEMAHRKGVFWSTIGSAAVAVPVNTTTNGSTFALINPSGSGVVAEVLFTKIDFLHTNAAPATANQIGWSIVPAATNAASAITRNPGPTAAATTGGINAYLGGAAPVCIAATAVTYASALTVAANWAFPLWSFPASWVPTVGGYPVPLIQRHMGELLVPPGWSITLTASTAWGATTVSPSMAWAEYLL